jgi:hypothetical protein
MVKDKGGKMPEFLSTHPTDANRLRRLEALLPEARKYYLAARKAATPPPPPRQWQSRNWSTPQVSPPPVAGRWLPLDR